MVGHLPVGHMTVARGIAKQLLGVMNQLPGGHDIVAGGSRDSCRGGS